MKKIWRKWIGVCVVGIGAVSPYHANGVGQILVYAFDISNSGHPPPLTTVRINGGSASNFGTNTHLLFSELPAGTHTVEVATAASGYLPRQSPSTPNAVGNLNSDYGNPRHVVVSNDALTSCSFSFEPFISASGTVRDKWTMDRIGEATIEFIYDGSTGSVTVCRYPEAANYAPNWQSRSDGRFPTNTMLHQDGYDLKITHPDYKSLYITNAITNTQVGDSISLKDLFLEPIDINTNQIDDLWELVYFGEGSNVSASADADGDGLCNIDEYWAGTNPTNATSVLTLSQSISNDIMTLTWSAEPNRSYRIIGTTDMGTGSWVQVAGPWETYSNQTQMSWTGTNMNLSWQAYYRADVVPCIWTGTNQILVRTNDWPTGGSGGGGYTNGLPPIP